MTDRESTTVEEFIEQARKEEERQSRNVIALIAQIHASPPKPLSAYLQQKWHRFLASANITRRPGAIPKFSRHRKRLIGWYQTSQRSGKPNLRMPIQIELDHAFEQWARAHRSAVPVAIAAKHRGILSGRKRREDGLAEKIIQLASLLLQQQPRPKKHHLAKLIARDLNCNLDYVRRILRRPIKGGIPKKT